MPSASEREREKRAKFILGLSLFNGLHLAPLSEDTLLEMEIPMHPTGAINIILASITLKSGVRFISIRFIHVVWRGGLLLGRGYDNQMLLQINHIDLRLIFQLWDPARTQREPRQTFRRPKRHSKGTFESIERSNNTSFLVTSICLLQ